jgi:hypothetical protein
MTRYSYKFDVEQVKVFAELPASAFKGNDVTIRMFNALHIEGTCGKTPKVEYRTREGKRDVPG